MRNSLMVAVLVAFLLSMASPTSAADIGGGMLNVGISETVEHAGVNNWSIEMHYTIDGRPPTNKDTIFGLLRTNQGEPAHAGYPWDYEVGQLLPGKFWAVVPFQVINGGKIKRIESEVLGYELPYAEALGGYLVDMERFAGRRVFIGVAVRHMGGRMRYQLFLFTARSEFEVADEAGFWMNIFHPGKEQPRAAIEAFKTARNFESVTGAHAYAEAHRGERQMPIRIQADPIEGGATIKVTVWADRARTQPATGAKVQLKSTDDRFRSPSIEVTNGLATIYVPPGTYRPLVGGGGRHYTLFNPNDKTFTVTAGETREIVIMPAKEGETR